MSYTFAFGATLRSNSGKVGIMGWFTQSQQKSLLGQLLIEQKLITEEQLAKAIEQQRKTGQRLGDIFAEWNLVAQHHVDQVVRKQRNLRLAAALAAMLMGPLEALASAPVPLPSTQYSEQSESGASDSQSGLRALTEEDLDSVSAQGLADNLLRNLRNNSSKGDGLQMMGNMVKLMNPLLFFLKADSTTIKNVVYDPGQSTAVVNKDGSITLSMPSSIGEINFDNIRVNGANPGASFGSIAIKNIDFRGTTLTVKAH